MLIPKVHTKLEIPYSFSFIHSFIHPSIHQWLYSSLLCPGLFLGVLIFITQTVGLLGRGISTSQSRYLHAGQHKHRMYTDIHALSGIRTHDPSVMASEYTNSLCLRPRDQCNRQKYRISPNNKATPYFSNDKIRRN
jgi:hypothetical protein